MTEPDLLPEYLEHLRARCKPRRDDAKELKVLPAAIAELASHQPDKCLELIVRALGEPLVPESVRAIGDDLLDNLLNERSAAVGDEVLHQLRTNKRFRQAFASGRHSSVDPAVIDEWVRLFQDLGTTKDAERKSLWKRAV
jgi:hypothetical protein